ncbi:MAG TPA: glycosyltransferase family 9 protein [Longimicrobiaceae bacterium]|jgi:heptosyltransferase I|nr:glycosyltransferase family 9 protein [Longimicrobiaceae bacterium]
MIEARLDRVCIVLLTAVGDAVHAMPVVTALKRRNPLMHLTWVLQPGPATLVRGHPGVDEIIEFDRKRGVRAFMDVRRELAGREFDLVLLLQPYLKAAVIAGFANAPVKLGFDRARARDLSWAFTTHRIPPHEPQHTQDTYFEFLGALGIPHEPVVWDIGPWDEERARQREFFATIDRPIVPLVIGTSKPEKDWASERWAAVADELHATFGLQPMLVGGRSERELAAEAAIMAKAAHKPLSALGSGLRPLVGILDGAALAISPDTGPLHMSVALGTPTVSLMGYTNPKRFGPWRRFHDLLIDAYGDPSEDYPASAPHRPGRMDRISVDDVLEKVALALERYPRSRSSGHDAP